MWILITFVIAMLMVAGLAFVILANNAFDDEDPDMYWYDETQVITCPHQGEKTDVVINASVTCETIHTVCDDCGQVLNVRIDC